MSTKMSLISADCRGLVIVFEEGVDSFAYIVDSLDKFIGNLASDRCSLLSDFSDNTAFS